MARSLHALKRVRAEDLYQFGIVNTLRFVDGLFQHLQHRVRLDLVPTNVGGRAAEPGDVLLLELCILKGREAWEPAAVGDEDALGDPGAADRAGELCPLVGSGHLEQHFGIEVLLFEALYERDGIIRRGTQHHDIGVCRDDLVSDRVPVGGLARDR